MTKVKFFQTDKVDQDAFEIDEEGRMYLDLKKLDSNITKVTVVSGSDFTYIFTTNDGKNKTIHIISFNELHFPPEKEHGKTNTSPDA